MKTIVKKFIGLMAISFVVLAGCTGETPANDVDDEVVDNGAMEENEDVMEEDAMESEGLKVRGYAMMVERPEFFCGEDCDIFRYVFLKLDEATLEGNAELKTFLSKMEGNAFAGPDAIGLGCINDQRLFVHDSWTKEMADVRSPEDFSKIMDSTEDAMVELTLSERTGLLEGEAPDCFSFYVIEEIDGEESLVVEKPKLAPMGDNFHEGGYLNVRGYATVNEVDEAWCFDEDCEVYDYVSFHVVPSDFDISPLEDFMEGNMGNAYVGDMAIGLGCLENGVISYANDSNWVGTSEFEIPEDDTAGLLAATEENPIDVQFVKYEMSGGRGAPTCYSHISKVNLL